MKNSDDVIKRYNLLRLKYPLIVIPLTKRLPFDGAIGLLDWWLRGEITRIVKDGKFQCDYGELMLFFSDSLRLNKNFLLFGLGNNNIQEKNILEVFAEDLKKGLESLKIKNFALVLSVVIEKSILNKFFKEFAIDIYT